MKTLAKGSRRLHERQEEKREDASDGLHLLPYFQAKRDKQCRPQTRASEERWKTSDG